MLRKLYSICSKKSSSQTAYGVTKNMYHFVLKRGLRPFVKRHSNDDFCFCRWIYLNRLILGRDIITLCQNELKQQCRLELNIFVTFFASHIWQNFIALHFSYNFAHSENVSDCVVSSRCLNFTDILDILKCNMVFVTNYLL